MNTIEFLKNLKKSFKKTNTVLDFDKIILKPNKIYKEVCNFLNIETSQVKINHSMRGDLKIILIITSILNLLLKYSI